MASSRRVTRQPAYIARIDFSNPICQGLTSAWYGNNIYSGAKSGIATNGGSIATSRYGVGRGQFLATSTQVDLPTGAFGTSATNGTRFALVRITTGTSNETISGGGATGSISWRIQGGVNIALVSTGVSVPVSASSVVSAGELCALGITVAPNDGRIFKNGAQIASSTSTQPNVASTTCQIGATGASGNRGNNDIFLHLSWDRTLSPAEMAAISANPWQVFRAPARRSFAVASATSSRTVTPSGGITFSGASTAIRSKTSTPTGGLTFAGAATVARVFTRLVTPSGGLSFSGAASVVRSCIRAVTGGILFSGAASVESEDVSAVSNLLYLIFGRRKGRR